MVKHTPESEEEDLIEQITNDIDNAAPENKEHVTYNQGHGYKTILHLFITILLPILSVGAFSSCPLTMIEDQIVYIQYGGAIGKNSHSNVTVNHSCNLNTTSEDHIQTETTRFRLYMRYGSCIGTAIFMPLWGAVSDIYGRHTAITTSCLGSMILTSSLLVTQLVKSAPLWILIIAETLHGSFGRGITIIVMACSAHVADVMPQGQRTFMMILIDFIHAIFAFAGSTVVGYVVKQEGYVYTIMLIIMLSLQASLFLYGTCVFSKLSKHKLSIHQNNINNSLSLPRLYGYFLKTYRTYRTSRKNHQRFILIVTLIIVLFYNIAFNGVDSVVNIYTLGPPLCWDTVIQGIYTGVTAGSSGIVPILIGLIFIKARGVTTWFLFLGLLSGLVSQCVFGIATSTLLMFVALVIGSPSNIIGSTSRSVIADNVEPTEQGAAMAGYVVVGIVAELVGNSIFTVLYTSTFMLYVRAFFFMAAGFYGAGLICLGMNVCIKKAQTTEDREHCIQNT